MSPKSLSIHGRLRRKLVSASPALIDVLRRSRTISTLRTTPWIACDPKWPLAGDPNTKVTLENGTSDPPLTQTCSMDNTVSFFEKGAGPPLPVIYAGPVTMNPGLVVIGGA